MRRFSPNDRRAAFVGAVLLAVILVLYPIVADAAARPLAVFVLPGLLTAVLGGWRPAALLGVISLLAAVVVGLLGPLDMQALIARWAIIAVGVAIGAIGSAVRERQSARLVELDEAMTVARGVRACAGAGAAAAGRTGGDRPVPTR